MSNVIKQEETPADATVFSFEELSALGRGAYCETCERCRANLKRDHAQAQVAGEIVDALARAGLSTPVAFEILGLAGACYALKRERDKR